MSKYQTIKNLSDDELVALMEEHISVTKAMIALECNPTDPRIRKLIVDKLDDLTYNRRMLCRHRYSKQEIIEAAHTALCLSDVIRGLGLKVHGGNSRTIRKLITEYEIDTSHFDLSAALRRNKRQWTFEDIFCKDSTYNRAALRKAVIRFKILDQICAECGLFSVWNENILVLQLDHINGICDDNRIENLRFLCPNCHSQTETWGRKRRIS